MIFLKKPSNYKEHIPALKTKNKTQMTFLKRLWSFSSLTFFAMYIIKGSIQHEESVSHMRSKGCSWVEEELKSEKMIM